MAFAVVQSKDEANSNASTTGNTAAISWTSNTTAGNLLVAIIGISATFTITTATSGWVKANSKTNSTFLQTDIWYKPNCSAADPTPVFTISSGVSTGYRLEIFEASGVSTTSPLDVTGTGSSTNSTTGTATVSSTITTGSQFVVFGTCVAHGDAPPQITIASTGVGGGASTGGNVILQTTDVTAGNALAVGGAWATSGASGTSPSGTFNLTGNTLNDGTATVIATFKSVPPLPVGWAISKMQAIKRSNSY